MKTTVTLSAFRSAFAAMGREDNFTFSGLEILFDYLESYEADTGEEIELDVIALCCDYQESTYSEIAESYSLDLTGLDEDEAEDMIQDFLNENTTVCGFHSTGAVFASF